MAETRKLAAILAADVAGYSRLTAADEERTVARLRGLRTDLIDPAISVHHGRVVKRMGDGILIEFRSVVDAVRCAIEVQNGMVERNAGLPPERRILFRVGIHLGDVIEEEDGDLMGDGVNIAARLEGIAEPGAICLSEQAYWQVKSRLDLAVSDLGAKDLKNIPEPVHVFSLEVGKPAQAKPTWCRRRGDSALVPLLAGLAALIVIVAAAWYFLARPGTNLAANAPAHLSIVVLPFQNLSGDPKQDYFADGITDNLTTDLSRIRNSFVIARNTAFTYKGKNVDAKEIGKELGVRYVLEGSVQRGGNRVRVNAQLIDAESGSHLWADRFEEDLADLFKLQDAIVARLARSLEIELASAESRHARPQNPDAIDVTMQGWAIMYRPPSKENDNAARALFERALTLDAEDDDALSGIAYANGRDYVYGWGDKSVNYDEKIIVPADRAIVLNPSNAMAFYIKSIHLSNTGRLDGAFAVADAGLNRNSNFAPLYVARAIAGLAQGRYDRARSDVLLALRLSPRDAQIGIWYSVLANLEMQLGHGGAAIDAARKAIEEGNLTWLPYAELASAYMSAGNAEEAHAALAEARRLNPKLSLAWVMSHSPRVPAFFDNLRKAGLPEDEPPKHLSIVVLPFTNLSGDPKQDYFADGITDNLTTDLSRIRNSFVIARNTAFTYKGKNVDAKEIGKELGVRYVLEGSVQRDGNRVRVNAQLIDAEKGDHLWADRFEEDLADLFKLQDDVVARLANSLGYELVKAEAEKGARAGKPDAIDLTMRGRALLWREPPTKDNNSAARGLFEKALQIDPDDADALAGGAWTYQNEYTFGWTSPGTDYDAKILGVADRAIAVAPDTLLAYRVKASYLMISRRWNEALGVVDAGLAIDPNSVGLYPDRGVIENILGRPDAAKSDLQQAMRLSPRDPNIGFWHVMLGDVEFHSSHFDAAIDEYHKAIDAGFRTFIPYGNLAAAYALEGKMDEARPALAEARRLNPNLTVKWLMAHAPNVPILFEGYRKAGLPEDAPPPPAKHLSIVVLPFTNLSGDPKQDYFADGITENLTTDLSRIRNSFVIARNTAFTFKGKNVDAKEIGKELGVRYVLEGSVQRDGNRVRVNAQLIDTATGAELWANRFEEDLADLFKLQDDVVARLANALGYELTIAEAAKGARSTNPDAIDLTMRGWALLNNSGRNEAANDAARAFFEQSLRLDPQNPDALAGEALTYDRDYVYGWAKSGIDYDSKILAQADRAIALDPDNVRAYWTKSTYLFVSNRPSEALSAADAGLAINPNFAPLHFARSGANLGLGRFEQAKAAITEAIRLSPRDPQLGLWYVPLGQAEMGLGHYEAAIEDAHKSINAGFVTYIPYADLAAAFALEGKMEEAKSALAEARRLTPQLTIKWLMAHSPHTPTSLDGLRKAGLPEDAAPPPKHLSIVVLPFDNLSGDPKQDCFADGITDNLTTDLSRIRNSFVIARNTAFTYKGKNVDAKEIGKELGVRYVLEGSVQRDGNRVRVNAQLIDAETGAELWADRFEEDLSDLFKLQDDVVARLARSTQIELVNAESQRGLHDRSQNPNAVDLTMQGWAILYGPPDKASFFKARPLLEEALKLDPRNAVALAGLSEIDRSDYIFNWSGANSGSYDRAMDEAVRANTIDPNLAYPYYVKSSLILYRLMPNDTVTGNEAFAAAQSALQMDPSFAPALYAMSAVKENQGDFEEEKKDLEQAIRMSPRDPGIGRWYMAMGRQQFAVYRYGSAVEWAAKALDAGYRTASPYLVLAAADAELQRDADARQAMAQARKLIPALSVKWCRAHIPSFFLQPPGFDDALRKARLPEQ